jgi:hypothetical protein
VKFAFIEVEFSTPTRVPGSAMMDVVFPAILGTVRPR